MAKRIGIGLLGSAGIGAGLMYLLDPAHGKRRRSRAFERPRSGGTTDRALTGRVRAALGRAVTHPRVVDILLEDGRVTLRGPVLASEVGEAVERVGRVAGVEQVVNELEPQDSSENIAALDRERRIPRAGMERDVWPSGVRVIAGSAGVGLGLAGVARGGMAGKLLAVGGAALLVRAVTNRSLTHAIGLHPGRRMVDLYKTIVIQAPIGEVFRFWTDIENFPRFMEHILDIEVSPHDGARSHWTVRGPGGVRMSWDAEVTRLVPDHAFGWKTLPGSRVEHAGLVEFEEVGPDATRCYVRMMYIPPAGAVGHAVATLVGGDPKSRMEEDLARMKALLEEGRTHSNGKSVTIDQVTPEDTIGT